MGEKLKEVLKKKRALYPIILLGELAIVIAIAVIFDLETHNSPFAAVAIYIIGGTIIWFLIKICKDHKSELAAIRFEAMGVSVLVWLYFVIGLLTSLLVLFLPLMILGIM